MIQITPQMRVLVAIEPVDFRRGIDGLSQVCRAVLSEDPMDGSDVCFPLACGESDQDCWSMTARDFGWRKSVCRPAASAHWPTAAERPAGSCWRTSSRP